MKRLSRNTDNILTYKVFYDIIKEVCKKVRKKGKFLCLKFRKRKI